MANTADPSKCRGCGEPLPERPVTVRYAGGGSRPEPGRTARACRSAACVNATILQVIRANDSEDALARRKGELIATASGITVSAPCRACGDRLVARDRNFLGSPRHALCADCL